MRHFCLLATSRFRSRIQSGFTTLFFFLRKVRSVATFSLKEIESRDDNFFGRTFKIYSVLLVDSVVVSKTFELLTVVIFNLDFCTCFTVGGLASSTKGSIFAPASVVDPDSGGVPGSVSGSKKTKMAQKNRNLSPL
jgi:hypothetical protein